MKKKIIYIIISIVTIIILFFGVKYLFITRIDIDDIKIEINSKYDFNSLKGKIRNKDIYLSNDSNIDYSKLGEYEVTLESHEKYAINTKKKVKVFGLLKNLLILVFTFSVFINIFLSIVILLLDH